ncbi:MAG: DUF1266 domain-containing protein [Collinsella intestinalis]|nr:DUF1266 domain-containing protein [Collinsella intestinalis]
MKCTKPKKLALVFCLTAALASAALQGCRAKTPEDMLARMQEFSTPDDTASIYLDKSWKTQEAPMDGWLIAASSREDNAVFLLQFIKNGLSSQAGSMEDVKDIIKTSYNLSGETKAEAPEVPGMTNVTAITGRMSVDSAEVDAYIVYGETDYAYYSMAYAADKMNDSKIASFKVSCSKFRENAPEVEDRTTAELTDTIRWFNASYAVLTDLNGWDYNRFAGLAANDDVMAMEQKSLEEWWSVTDRATADSTLDWILTEGHRATFAEDMAYLEEAGIRDIAPQERGAFLLDQFEMTEDEAQNYAEMFGFYEQYGPDAIAGWDYCRAMNLMSFYYLAGYYTEQEALDTSLEIARTMQPLFESWDDLMSSYMRGYEYWAEESADERRALYEDLKTRQDNPYSVDFKMQLEKTW